MTVYSAARPFPGPIGRRVAALRWAFDSRDGRHHDIKAISQSVGFLEDEVARLREAPVPETVNRDSMILALAWSLNATPEEVAEQIELLRGER